MTGDKFYNDSLDDGYGGQPPIRFSMLETIGFTSVLDVGSGPCSLQKWLCDRGYTGHYEAVDIREDALTHCQCMTHTEIPNNQYDLVCLFGTKGYNENKNKELTREEYKQLLSLSYLRTTKYLVFSVIKKEYDSDRIMGYSVDDVFEIIRFPSLNVISINSEIEPSEHIFVCMKNEQST